MMSKTSNKKIPMRTCVGCRQSKPKKELIRMVKNEGKVVVDRSGKQNGRGIYLCDDPDCFEGAKKKKAINRGLDITLTEEEIQELQKELFKV